MVLLLAIHAQGTISRDFVAIGLESTSLPLASTIMVLDAPVNILGKFEIGSFKMRKMAGHGSMRT
jgi:hypothetical protein